MEQIFVIAPFSEEEKQKLCAAAPLCRVSFPSPEELESRIGEADMIVGNPPPALLRRAGRLRLLQLESSGANQYAAPGVLPAGAQLACATGSYGPGIAEYLIAYTMSLFLRLPAYHDNQKQGLWRDEGSVRSVAGSVALSVGMGDIGGEYARRFYALGGTVIGVCRTARRKPEFVKELYRFEQLDELLPLADVVALSLPETPQTAGLMDARRLSLMKPGSILLNAGRGSAVVTDNLLDALRSGHLGGAGLDVTAPEPLPPDHPLWKEPNCIITQHISGGRHFAITRQRIFSICLENVRIFALGGTPTNLVDRSTGYLRSRP